MRIKCFWVVNVIVGMTAGAAAAGVYVAGLGTYSIVLPILVLICPILLTVHLLVLNPQEPTAARVKPTPNGIPNVVGGFVYFIVDKTRGLVKIGYSYDPMKRISDLQTGNGGRLELLASVRGTMKTERRLQELWEDLRTSGEWFRLTPRLESFAARINGMDCTTDIPAITIDDIFSEEVAPIVMPTEMNADLLEIFKRYDNGAGGLRYGWKTKAMDVVGEIIGVPRNGDNYQTICRELDRHVELYRSGEY